MCLPCPLSRFVVDSCACFSSFTALAIFGPIVLFTLVGRTLFSQSAVGFDEDGSVGRAFGVGGLWKTTLGPDDDEDDGCWRRSSSGTSVSSSAPCLGPLVSTVTVAFLTA